MMKLGLGITWRTPPVNFWNPATAAIDQTGGAVSTYTAATGVFNISTPSSTSGYPRLRFTGLTVGATYSVTGQIDGARTNIGVVRLASAGSANNLTYNSTTGEISGSAVSAGDGRIEFTSLGTPSGSYTIASLVIRRIA